MFATVSFTSAFINGLELGIMQLYMCVNCQKYEEKLPIIKIFYSRLLSLPAADTGLL